MNVTSKFRLACVHVYVKYYYNLNNLLFKLPIACAFVLQTFKVPDAISECELIYYEISR